MIIDSHQHLWDPGQADYTWLDAWVDEYPPAERIRRPIGIDEVVPTMRANGIAGAVLVQSLDDDRDTDHLLWAASERPDVVGVVGWIPLDRPERAHQRLAELRRQPVVVGIRALIHDQPDAEWILRSDVAEGLTLLEESGLPFDYLTSSPAALALLPTIADRHPRLTIVIDHLGKPPVAGSTRDFDDWRALLRDAAGLPRVAAKLSGLPPLGGGFEADQLNSIVLSAVEILGADRLMFGSDWPVVELAGGFDQAPRQVLGIVRTLDPDSQSSILADTAIRTYRLDPGRLRGAEAALHAYLDPSVDS